MSLRTNRKTKGKFRVQYPAIFAGMQTMTGNEICGRCGLNPYGCKCEGGFVLKSPLENIFDSMKMKGRYADQTKWLRDHGFAYFGEHSTPEGYIWETHVDNDGNVIRIKIDRPSDVRMEDATIVDSEYEPKPESRRGKELMNIPIPSIPPLEKRDIMERCPHCGKSHSANVVCLPDDDYGESAWEKEMGDDL